MTNKALKDVLWAGAIGLCLIVLLVGFAMSAILRYGGDRERPVMDLSAGREKGHTQEDSTAMTADGSLHLLSAGTDAGQTYLDSLCFLCDSSLIGLRDAGLVSGQVWGSETGTLSMAHLAEWSIRYPADGSNISPVDAAMIVKPKLLVVAIGSDGLTGITREDFVAGYEGLIKSIIAVSPDTVVVCCSLCSVTGAYISSDALSAALAAEVNTWIRQVCTETGAYYAELDSVTTSNGYLRSDYAEPDGKTLNTAGLQAVLDYLSTHSVKAN